MRLLCLHLLYIFVFSIEGCQSPSSFKKIYVDKEIDVYKGNVSSVGSKGECTATRSASPTRHSFQYNRNSGRCITNPVSFEALWDHNLVSLSGNYVYHRIGSNAIGSRCSVDGDCVSVGAICFQDSQACACEPGYSYHLSTDTCLTACAVYGSEMTVYEGLSIAGHNLRSVSDVSVGECVTECVTDAACRTFDYNIQDQSCFLQAVNFHGAPDGQISGNMDWLHGHRDCDS